MEYVLLLVGLIVMILVVGPIALQRKPPEQFKSGTLSGRIPPTAKLWSSDDKV